MYVAEVFSKKKIKMRPICLLRVIVLRKKERKKTTPFLFLHFYSFFEVVLLLLWSPHRLIMTELIETERLYVEELQSIIEVQSSLTTF